MNAHVEGEAYGSRSGSSAVDPNYYCYNKMSDIVNPPPSLLWIFNDEQPDSINDGWEVNRTDPNAGWVDLPASYHGGTGGFSFADAHAEIKKWQEKSTIVRVTRSQLQRVTHHHQPRQTLGHGKGHRVFKGK